MQENKSVVFLWNTILWIRLTWWTRCSLCNSWVNLLWLQQTYYGTLDWKLCLCDVCWVVGSCFASGSHTIGGDLIFEAVGLPCEVPGLNFEVPGLRPGETRLNLTPETLMFITSSSRHLNWVDCRMSAWCRIECISSTVKTWPTWGSAWLTLVTKH